MCSWLPFFGLVGYVEGFGEVLSQIMHSSYLECSAVRTQHVKGYRVKCSRKLVPFWSPRNNVGNANRIKELLVELHSLLYLLFCFLSGCVAGVGFLECALPPAF